MISTLRSRNPVGVARSISRVAGRHIDVGPIRLRSSLSSCSRSKQQQSLRVRLLLSRENGGPFVSDDAICWSSIVNSNGNNKSKRPLPSLMARRCLSSSSSNENKDKEISKRQEPRQSVDEEENPSTDHFSVMSAYGWLVDGLKKDKSLSAMAAATIFMAGEGLMANQPAILLGKIVDEVGSTPLVQDTTSTPPPATASTITEMATTAAETASTIPAGVETVWPLLTLIGLSIVCKEACTIGRKYLVERSSTSLQKTAFLQQARHLLAVRVDALQDQRVGSLVVKLDKSVEGLIKLQKVTFLEGAPNVAAAAVALAYAWSEHPMVGGTMLGVVAAGSAVTAAQIASQKGIRIDLNEKKARMGAGVVDLLNNLGYIRASGMRSLEERRLDGIAERVRATEFTHHKYMMSFSGARDVVEQAGFVIVVGGAVHLALAGEITSGAILTLAMLYSKATQPLQKMHKVLDEGHESVIKVGIMGPLRALPSDPGLDGALQFRNDFPHPLVANNLTLKRGRKPVLQSLSVSLNRGEIIGVAGPSGSGKSTLLKVALGLIPDYSGSLALLGAEARDADKAALSQALLYAQQEPFVLTGTIRENLLATIGPNTDDDDENGYTDDDLLLALQRASLNPSDFSDWSTHGLDTPIHEAGRNLSGGQRQRLALARIFLLLDRAQLVVLDEATSALDNVTEARVIDELERRAQEGGKTVVMVAHRLSTLRRADRVIVMDEGAIVQDGTFSELEGCKGPFRDLLEARASTDEDS